MSGRGNSAPLDRPGVVRHYGVIIRDEPLALEEVKLMTPWMEKFEGVIVLMYLYMGNPKYTQGLHRLAREHAGALEEIKKLELSVAPFANEIGEGRPHVLLELLAGKAEQIWQLWNLSEMRRYTDALARYRREWNLVGVNSDAEALWQAMACAQVAEMEGLLPWRSQADEWCSSLIWGKRATRTMEVSLYELVRNGVKGTVQGLSHRLSHELRPDLHRPRVQRSDSLKWLYMRLGEGFLSSEIAHQYDKTEESVARFIKRDADLLGLKLPRGYPRGRKRGATGRMIRR